MKTKLMFALVATGFFLTQLTLTIYQPAMPSLANFMQVSSRQVMLTISVFFYGYALGHLLWGSLSDHIGRRRSIIMSLMIYIAAVLVVILSHHLNVFNLAYAVMGFAAAAYTSVGNAIIKDIFGQQHAGQMIARIGVVMAVGPIIGTALGSQLSLYWSWQSSFIVLFILAAVLLIGSLYCLPETHQQIGVGHKSKIKLFSAYIALLSHFEYCRYVLALGLSFSGLFSFIGTAPFIFQKQLHITPQQYSWLFPLIMMVYASGAILASLTINRISCRRLVSMGVTLGIVGSGLLVLQSFFLSPHIILVLASMMLMLLGFGIVMPSAKAGAMTVLKDHHGTAASLMKFLQTITAMVVTSIAAMINANQSLLIIAIVLFSVTMLSAVVLIILHYLGCRTYEMSNATTSM